MVDYLQAVHCFPALNAMLIHDPAALVQVAPDNVVLLVVPFPVVLATPMQLFCLPLPKKKQLTHKNFVFCISNV